jgi:hypothetical protein
MPHGTDMSCAAIASGGASNLALSVTVTTHSLIYWTILFLWLYFWCKVMDACFSAFARKKARMVVIGVKTDQDDGEEGEDESEREGEGGDDAGKTASDDAANEDEGEGEDDDDDEDDGDATEQGADQSGSSKPESAGAAPDE